MRTSRGGEGILETRKADNETDHIYRVQEEAAVREVSLVVDLGTLPVAQTKRTALQFVKCHL
jgi:hypothetical protein